MVMRTRFRFICVLILGLLAPTRSASAHPIHMSYTEIRTAAGGITEISVRVYANDFSAAAARREGTKLGSDSLVTMRTALAYLASNLELTDLRGTRIALTSCGVTKGQDMLRFCFKPRTTINAASLRVRNRILTELFANQVNVVQVVSAKGRTSRLFVKGDTWKPLG